MVPTIRVDEEVYAALQGRAKPFEDSPNSILRRVLGLEEPDALVMPATPATSVWLVPDGENKTVADSVKFLKELRDPTDMDGIYRVVNGKKWGKIPAGSMCLFHKKRQILGEGKLLLGLHPCRTPGTNPDGKPYVGQVRFDPITIKLYDPGIAFRAVELVLRRTRNLPHRDLSNLTLVNYHEMRKLVTSSY